MFSIDLYFYCEKKSEKLIRDFLAKYNADNGKLTVSEALVYRNEEMYSDNLQGEWIEIKDTDSWIKLGLSEHSLAFSIYYSLPTHPVNGLIIAFTFDGGIIFGIYMEENEINLDYAKKLLGILKKEYNAILGALFIEEPPFLSKDLFIQSINERAIYSE
jgi:hypothetical protein